MGNRQYSLPPSPADYRPFVNFSYNDGLKMLGKAAASIDANGLPSAPLDLHLNGGEYSGNGNIVNGHQSISQISNINFQLLSDSSVTGEWTLVGDTAFEQCTIRNGRWLTNGWITFEFTLGTEEVRYRGILDGEKYIGRWYIVGVENDLQNENELRRKTGSFHWKLRLRTSMQVEAETEAQLPPYTAASPPMPLPQPSKSAPCVPQSNVVAAPPKYSQAAAAGYPGAVSSSSSSSSSITSAARVPLPVAQPVARPSLPGSRPSQPQRQAQSQNGNNQNNQNNGSGIWDIFGKPSLGIDIGMPLGRIGPAWAGLRGYVPIKL